MMTIFIWTPRIGSLAKENDLNLYAHYKKELTKQKPNWDKRPSHVDGAPYINASFTNWEPVRM